MNLGKKIVSVVAGVALVAGAGAMAAAPAQAKPKTKGITVISFDKKLAPALTKIIAVSPAKKSGTQLSFPVSKVVGDGVEHKGAIEIGGLVASNPIIIIDTENSTAVINLSVGGNPLELFTIKNFKIRSDNAKQQRWQGFLHLTSSQAIVDALNGAAGTTAFKPGMGLGQIRTTINK
jgi:hypothetical protein